MFELFPLHDFLSISHPDPHVAEESMFGPPTTTPSSFSLSIPLVPPPADDIADPDDCFYLLARIHPPEESEVSKVSEVCEVSEKREVSEVSEVSELREVSEVSEVREVR